MNFEISNFRFEISCVKKQMKAAEQYREHTSRHTSPEDGDARDSRKATASSSGRLPAFISKVAQTLVCEFLQLSVITVEITD